MNRLSARSLPGVVADAPGLDAAASSPLAWIRQPLACALLLLLSARIPGHLAALVAALSRAGGALHQAVAMALLTLLLDGFGVLCAVYLSHARLRGVPLLGCYPPQRLIPLSLHFLGMAWGLLTLTQSLAGGGSVR